MAYFLTTALAHQRLAATGTAGATAATRATEEVDGVAPVAAAARVNPNQALAVSPVDLVRYRLLPPQFAAAEARRWAAFEARESARLAANGWHLNDILERLGANNLQRAFVDLGVVVHVDANVLRLQRDGGIIEVRR